MAVKTYLVLLLFLNISTIHGTDLCKLDKYFEKELRKKHAAPRGACKVALRIKTCPVECIPGYSSSLPMHSLTCEKGTWNYHVITAAACTKYVRYKLITNHMNIAEELNKSYKEGSLNTMHQLKLNQQVQHVLKDFKRQMAETLDPADSWLKYWNNSRIMDTINKYEFETDLQKKIMFYDSYKRKIEKIEEFKGLNSISKSQLKMSKNDAVTAMKEVKQKSLNIIKIQRDEKKKELKALKTTFRKNAEKEYDSLVEKENNEFNEYMETQRFEYVHDEFLECERFCWQKQNSTLNTQELKEYKKIWWQKYKSILEGEIDQDIHKMRQDPNLKAVIAKKKEMQKKHEHKKHTNHVMHKIFDLAHVVHAVLSAIDVFSMTIGTLMLVITFERENEMMTRENEIKKLMKRIINELLRKTFWVEKFTQKFEEKNPKFQKLIAEKHSILTQKNLEDIFGKY